MSDGIDEFMCESVRMIRERRLIVWVFLFKRIFLLLLFVILLDDWY